MTVVPFREPSLLCASALQIVRQFESIAETQPQLHPALLRLSASGAFQRTSTKLTACSLGKRSILSARVREQSANKQRTMFVRPFVFLGTWTDGRLKIPTAFPASQDRARIVFDCWTANGCGHDVIDDSCTRLRSPAPRINLRDLTKNSSNHS
jgi:hypothetical protein